MLVTVTRCLIEELSCVSVSSQPSAADLISTVTNDSRSGVLSNAYVTPASGPGWRRRQSHMDGALGDGQRRLFCRFRQRRVRVACACQIFR